MVHSAVAVLPVVVASTNQLTHVDALCDVVCYVSAVTYVMVSSSMAVHVSWCCADHVGKPYAASILNNTLAFAADVAAVGRQCVKARVW
jgi:hypothetical protein